MKEAPRAIEYLKGRGLTGTIAARFGLGYAPDDWQSLTKAFSDYQSKALETEGLVIAGEGGKRYDRFRGRIMFPIHDSRGQVIGFGGRVLDEGEPKYLNSPETPVFAKGRELYGLFQARQAIRSSGRVVVVEGYMDVIALAQHGVEYAVATLGTATTPVHAQKLFRLTDTVVFCFDGDEAGRRAAWRALENALPELSDGKQPRFLFLPQGEDPDDAIRRRGREAFETLVDSAIPLSEFFTAYRKTAARPDEIITAVEIPKPLPQSGPRCSRRCCEDVWRSLPACPRASFPPSCPGHAIRLCRGRRPRPTSYCAIASQRADQVRPAGTAARPQGGSPATHRSGRRGRRPAALAGFVHCSRNASDHGGVMQHFATSPTSRCSWKR